MATVAQDTLAARPVTELHGVGERLAARLHRLGIETLQDLLFHLPLRYQDRTRTVPIGTLEHGNQVAVEGVIESSEVHFGRRRSLLVRLYDGTGYLTLRFFYFGQTQRDLLVRGSRLRCFGEARNGPRGIEMVHPEYQLPDRDDDLGGDELLFDALTPIYPTTSGLQQPMLRRLIMQAIELLIEHPLTEWLPTEQLTPLPSQPLLPGVTAAPLPPLNNAIVYLHYPPPDADQQLLSEGRHPAQQRLAYEELLAHQLGLRRLHHRTQQLPAPALSGDQQLRQQLLANLPFRLTAAQQRVVAEIAADLERPQPMQRLVQGDVGAGKTVVAALALLQAIECGQQVALMAPTELLAEQHYRNFSHWLEPLGIQICWLTGRIKGRLRRSALEDIALGNAQLTIGTHALFQQQVLFRQLGLVVVDEQHRFGVHQRLALRDKGRDSGQLPHQLIMTATPIPRTLAQTAYADLDISVIDELPPGRTPVVTAAIDDSRRAEVVERIYAACLAGQQAYWVCTLVEESEVLQAQAAAATAEQLTEALPQLQVGLLHGRMSSEEKGAVMAAFQAAEIDLLVATTVIEVGVDVPNASLMIIENAERFGLAQLHQLRGRVGRGATRSSCVLLYHPPLTDVARERLAMMRDTGDGFLIAQKDLELRGPGELLGTRQTGMWQFRIADLVRDEGLLDRAHEAADALLEKHPERVAPLIARWLGERERYGDV